MVEDLQALKSELADLVKSMKPMHLSIAKSLTENKTQEEAYLLAGGKGKQPRVQASALIQTNPNISRYVEVTKLIASEHVIGSLEITEELIMRELAKLAFSNVKRLYSESGRLMEPHELPDEVAAAITKVKETVIRRDNDNHEELVRREYEFADKKGSLQLLGNTKAIQMFRENTVVTNKYEELTEEQLDAKLAELRRKAGRSLSA